MQPAPTRQLGGKFGRDHGPQLRCSPDGAHARLKKRHVPCWMLKRICNILLTAMTATSNGRHRGALIVLEGLDRCGKTTQTELLQLRLGKDGVLLRFPDRTTATGKLIDQYLQSSNHLDDRSIHLLFSANRWEACDEICRLLAGGRTVVCDRYAYSGVAFSSAKGLDMDWCKAPDRGLPAPDCVLFLDVAQEEAERRGGYGNERYERRDMQLAVRAKFDELGKLEGERQWHLVDAGRSVDDVHAEIWDIVQRTIDDVHRKPALGKLWQPGFIELSAFSLPDDKENRSLL